MDKNPPAPALSVKITPVKITQVREADLDALVRLLRATYQHYGATSATKHLSDETLRARLQTYLGRSPGYDAVLAKDERGVALGYALYAETFWTSECDLTLLLKEIFVLKPYRNQGVGLALMHAVAIAALNRGCERMIWAVDRHNRNATRFYKRFPGAIEQKKRLYGVEARYLERWVAGQQRDSNF